MRILAFLLLLPACVVALTPQDEAGIRAAIEEQAKIDNQKGSGRIWSERGPLTYTVRKTESISADVATSEVDGARAGTFPERGEYLFILTRTEGRWRVAKRVQVCPNAGFQLICRLSRSAE